MNALVIIIVLLAILEVATRKRNGGVAPAAGRELYAPRPGAPDDVRTRDAVEALGFDAARFAAAARSSQSLMEDVGLDRRTWAGSQYLRDNATPLTARVVSRAEDLVPGSDFVSTIGL
jgi:hypothetical protein